jgi:hypothetical protein
MAENIFKKAKAMRKAHPRKFKTWSQYVEAAGKVIHRKTRTRSVAGRSRPAKKKASRPRTRRKSTARSPIRYAGSGSGISTNSKRHTDYNRNKVNISVGALSMGSISNDKKRAKKKIEALIGMEEVKKFKATRKPVKRKIAKKISALKSDYRRLSI